MAIINCSECGNQISDKAKKCIHCGKVFEEDMTELNEIICKECGNAIPESLTECPNCGCPVFSRPKFEFKLTKKVKFILCSIIGVIIIACIGTAIYNSTPVQSYIAQVEQDRSALKASETAFKEAKEAEKNNNYELAIKKYKAVIKEDKSYNKAQKKIEELKDTYKTQLLSEAENYAQNKKYKEAIQNVDMVISTLGSSDELTELKQKYIDLKESQYAKIAVVEKISTPKDTANWIFSNYVHFAFEITNKGDKAIKGIEGNLTVNDLFGKKIITIGCDFTGEIIDPEEFYGPVMSFECNEFIDEHMKLFNTDYSDLQFSYDITKVVYADGTTVIPE